VSVILYWFCGYSFAYGNGCMVRRARLIDLATISPGDRLPVQGSYKTGELISSLSFFSWSSACRRYPPPTPPPPTSTLRPQHAR
jgi:hypothetical protein